MGHNAPLTRWSQLLLVPPPSIHVRLLCAVHGPTNTITYTVVVEDPQSLEEMAAQTTVASSASVLPEIAVNMLRDQLVAARVAVSPF